MSSSQGDSSSRGAGRKKKSDKLLVDELVDRMLSQRQSQVLQFKRAFNFCQGGALPIETVVGGFVKSYSFQYTPGQPPIAQGQMRVEFTDGESENHHVTMVIINPADAEEGTVAERIVLETQKLADYPDVIVEAYFSDYCAKIDKYIVVYEQFDGYFNPEAGGYELFTDEHMRDLTDRWRHTMRTLIKVLTHARLRNVEHGGLSRKDSYVVSSGEVKLINVARRHSNTLDITSLGIYFSTELEATTSDEWKSLDFLLKSRAMASQQGWDEDLLNHPILLGSPGDKLTSYANVEVFMWRLTASERMQFANAMFCFMPGYYGSKLSDHYKHCMTNTKYIVYDCVYNRADYHGNMYCNIVRFVRNLILHHGEHTVRYDLLAWSDEVLVEEITKSFPAFISMAYSLIKVHPSDWRALFKGQKFLPYRALPCRGAYQ